MADMQGFATSRELSDLYFRLKVLKDEKALNDPFCLFVIGRGFLNGNETLEYLESNFSNL